MKKIISLILTLFIGLNLTACQLAVDIDQSSNDKLVGVFITTEYLDTFELDSSTYNNIEDLTSSLLDKENARIYATMKDYRYVFEDLNGIPFYSYDIEDENQNICSVTDDSTQIFDRELYVNYSDDGTSFEISGTVKFLKSNEYITLFINQVYQTEDGSLYLTTGQGISSNGEGSSSQTIQQEISTTNINGEVENYSINQTIYLQPYSEVEKYKIIQMDENNTQIDSSEYIPQFSPVEFTPNSNTQYLIIEEISTQSTRTIVEKNTDIFDIKVLDENDFFTNGCVHINW